MDDIPEFPNNKIQGRALETWYEPDHELYWDFLPSTLGLVGESGEFADLIKKRAFKPGAKVDIWDLTDELGDVLYYVAILATQLGFTLDQISEMNYAKLVTREQNNNGYNKGITKQGNTRDAWTDCADHQHT